YPGPETRPDRTELQPDHAAADHNQALRHRGEIERAGGGNDLLLVESDLDARNAGDGRTGRDHNIARLDLLRSAIRVGDEDLAGIKDGSDAAEGLDLVLLQQEFDAFDIGVDGGVLVRQHLLQIELGL